ncbi:MAG: hypothetical protein Q8Q12_02820 [bacterium]|nr:hypothetical protein [bacterium]
MSKFRRIEALCSVGSFVFGAWSAVEGNHCTRTYVLFGIGLVLLLVVVTPKRRGAGKGAEDRTIVLDGIEKIPPPYEDHELRVFYPRPFVYAPHLEVRFRKGRRFPKPVDDLRFGRTDYVIREQRPDGFMLLLRQLGEYDRPEFVWRAEGRPKD